MVITVDELKELTFGSQDEFYQKNLINLQKGAELLNSCFQKGQSSEHINTPSDLNTRNEVKKLIFSKKPSNRTYVYIDCLFNQVVRNIKFLHDASILEHIHLEIAGNRIDSYYNIFDEEARQYFQVDDKYTIPMAINLIGIVGPCRLEFVFKESINSDQEFTIEYEIADINTESFEYLIKQICYCGTEAYDPTVRTGLRMDFNHPMESIIVKSNPKYSGELVLKLVSRCPTQNEYTYKLVPHPTIENCYLFDSSKSTVNFSCSHTDFMLLFQEDGFETKQSVYELDILGICYQSLKCVQSANEKIRSGLRFAK